MDWWLSRPWWPLASQELCPPAQGTQPSFHHIETKDTEASGCRLGPGSSLAMTSEFLQPQFPCQPCAHPKNPMNKWNSHVSHFEKWVERHWAISLLLEKPVTPVIAFRRMAFICITFCKNTYKIYYKTFKSEKHR